MAMMGFAISPALVEQAVTQAKVLPTFKRRWWYCSNRLDARPVIWSLENHPEEWELTGGARRGESFILRHTPSNHQFWVSSIFRSVSLRSGGGCGCGTRTDFQWRQGRKVYRAAQRLARPPVNIDVQFASHFVR